MTVKARVQGNAIVVTLPKDLNVREGTKFDIRREKQGIIKLIPSEEKRDLNQLFKNWHGKLDDKELDGWKDSKPKGDELW